MEVPDRAWEEMGNDLVRALGTALTVSRILWEVVDRHEHHSGCLCSECGVVGRVREAAELLGRPERAAPGGGQTSHQRGA